MTRGTSTTPRLASQLRYWLAGWRQRFDPRSPLYLTFFVTGRCNASCPQCFYADHNTAEQASRELTLEEVEAFTRKLGHLPVLLLSGGEPTLRKDLPSLIRAFHKNAGTRYVTLPTNGLLPETTARIASEVMETCPGLKLVIQLAVDEIGERHDQLRGMKGAFSKLMETFERLRALERDWPNLGVAFCLTFSAHNQDRVPAIFEELARRTSSHELRILLTRGNPRNPESTRWDIDKFERAVESMFATINQTEPQRSLSRSVFLARQQASERAIVETVRSDRAQASCLAGRVNAVLDETGNVYPCELLDEPMGNIRESDYSLERVFTSEKAERIRRHIRGTRCHCTHETNVITNISFVPTKWLRIGLDTLRFKFRS